MAQQPQQINIGAALVLAAVVVAGAVLIVAIDWPDGPATRCAARGGYIMTGPAGETSCLNRNTFLPLPEPGDSQISR